MIKIKLNDGEVPIQCMILLGKFAEHKDECFTCTFAQIQKSEFAAYCSTGKDILRKLSEQPEVSEYTD